MPYLLIALDADPLVRQARVGHLGPCWGFATALLDPPWWQAPGGPVALSVGIGSGP